MRIAITGHRPEKLGGYGASALQDAVRAAIQRYLMDWRPAGIISGMALGVDQWSVREALELGIPFVAAVPFKGQESVWPERDQRVYQQLLKKAAKVVVVSEGGYMAHKMRVRNRWMVDRCDRLLAVWDGSRGGTANCAEHAYNVGKPVDNLWRPDMEGLR